MHKCHDCREPAAPGRTRCAKHLLADYISTKRYRRNHPGHEARMQVTQRQRYRDAGRCDRCGLKLDPDADAGRVHCLNCREELCSF